MIILIGITMFVSSLLTATIIAVFRAPELARRRRSERPYALYVGPVRRGH